MVGAAQQEAPEEPKVEAAQQEAPEEPEAEGAQQPEFEEANDQPQVTYRLVEF
jgi:hypothetical protein